MSHGKAIAPRSFMAISAGVRRHLSSRSIVHLAVGALCSALVLLSFALRPALAQPGANWQETPVEEAAETGHQVEQQLDPHIDHGFILPTAFLQPAGTYKLHSRELVLVGLQKTFGDRFQASLSTLALPAAALLLEMKGRLFSGERTHVALSGHAGFAVIPLSGMVGAIGGLVVTRCLDPICGTTLTVTAMLGRFGEQGEYAGSSWTGLQTGLSFHRRIHRGIKLMAEGQLTRLLPHQESDEPGTEIQLTGGFRLHGKRGAIDLGLILAPGRGGDGRWHLRGGMIEQVFTPWVNLSYRWL